MPDLTIIMLVVAGLAVAGAVVFFLKNRDKEADKAPVLQQAPDVAALQAALKQAIDKLHASTPAQTAVIPPESRPIPATLPPESRQPDGTIPLGTTAPTWQAPPPPWPIDARYLSAAQIAALTPEETGRANMWQQALMSAAMTGNGQNPVPAALMIYRAGMTATSDLNKPLDEVWQAIFAAYGVPVPVPTDQRPWVAAAPRPGDAAYDVRLQQ